MRHRFRSSNFFKLFNFGDERAQGRCVMLTSSVMTSIVTWMTSGLFYTSFLMANGIDLVKIGIISFVPFIANCFSIFAPSILERFPRRRWVLFGGRLTYYTLNILAVTIMPMFVHDPDARTVCFAVLVFLANIINALFAGGYAAWHINFIPNEIRSEYFYTSSMISFFFGNTMGFLSALLADAFAASPYAYTIIIVLRFTAYGLALFELWALTRPKEYPYEKTGTKVHFSDIFTKPFSRPKYLRTILVIMVWTFACNTTSSSTNYYLLNNIGTKYSFVSFINLLYPFTMLLLMKPAQRFISHFGWFKSFAIGAILYSIPAFFYSFVTVQNYLWLLPAVRISQHVIGVAMNTGYSNLSYVNLPTTDRTDYLAFETLATNAAAFFGMVFGTWFVACFPNLLLTIGGFSFCTNQVLMWFEAAGRALAGCLVFFFGTRMQPDDYH